MSNGTVFELNDFKLQSGIVLPKVKLSFETHGTLNKKGDNAILYPTWYAGTHQHNRELIGKGRALDPENYFIIVTDMFGNGLSSSPSNTPAPWDRGRFPLFTAYDNVAAQHRLVFEHLKVKRLALVLGYSMSAQQAYHWGALYSPLVERIAAICGSARTSPHNWLFLEGVKSALQADSEWNNGEYKKPPLKGLTTFSTGYTGWCFSQEFFRQGLHLGQFFGQETQGMDDFLKIVREGSFLPVDANDLLAMVATWQATDVSAHPMFKGNLDLALGAIKSKALIMPCQTDLYFPPEDNRLEVAKMPDATLSVIPSIWGHVAGFPMINPADTHFIEDALKELLQWQPSLNKNYDTVLA